MSSFFLSIFGWIFASSFLSISSYFFYIYGLKQQSAGLSLFFSKIFAIMLLYAVALTIRMFVWERKNKTEAIVLSAPVSAFGIVFAKYISSVIIYSFLVLPIILFGVILNYYAFPNWYIIIGGVLLLLLMGMAFISVGMFVSSFFKSMFTSSVTIFTAFLWITGIDAFILASKNSVMVDILSVMSFSRHFASILMGILRLADIVYFLSIIISFFLLSIFSVVKRRWDGANE